MEKFAFADEIGHCKNDKECYRRAPAEVNDLRW